MSRAIKVPEALYDELRAEADRDGVAVMDALQRRLRAGAEELAALRTARASLVRRLSETERKLEATCASSHASERDAAMLREETMRLRNGIESSQEQIAELEELLDEQAEEAGSHRRARDAAERAAARQREALRTVAIVAGVGVLAFLGWKWFQKRQMTERQDETKRRALAAREFAMGI